MSLEKGTGVMTLQIMPVKSVDTIRGYISLPDCNAMGCNTHNRDPPVLSTLTL
jgi:hypothetical protein